MDLAKLANLHAESLAAVAAAGDAAALEEVRIRYLGRHGLLPAVMKQLKEVPPAERPEFGRRANAWRAALDAAMTERAAAVAARPDSAAAPFDCSLPGRWWRCGAQHPVSRVIDEVVRIFGRLGFTVADGPDIETRFNNFTALNTAPHHPSMDAADTFWFDDDKLLRTQTSPVQIRAMLDRQPPVRIVTPGRCYRRDTTDATHSANFHQIEGLYVDTTPVSLADLKATLAHFARAMMGPRTGVRFRPHFFPFTEPSAELDVSCFACDGGEAGCRVCGGAGWLEMAGCGMVDPNVFAAVGYDPDEVTGFAFGMGVERLAMVRHGITSIRHFIDNDVRFLGQVRS